jgi:hypothetical protein
LLTFFASRCSAGCALARRRRRRTRRSSTRRIAPSVTAPTGSAGTGPALIAAEHGSPARAGDQQVIAEGRDATQMPGFAQTLNKDEIAALTAFVSRRSTPPAWGAAEIAASRVIERKADPALEAAFSKPIRSICSSSSRPAIITPPSSTATSFEPLTRFPTRFALHGGPKFTPDGRFVFFMSRDGWVEKYDLWTLSEDRRGARRRERAQHRLVPRRQAYRRRELSAEHAGRAVGRRSVGREDLRGGDSKGKASRVSAVYQARPRDSFVVALKDAPEIWEIGTRGFDAAAAPHRRIDEPLDDFFFDPAYRMSWLGARGRGGESLRSRQAAAKVKPSLRPARPAASGLGHHLRPGTGGR